MIWMISLRMFFVFEVEVLEVLGGFKLGSNRASELLNLDLL